MVRLKPGEKITSKTFIDFGKNYFSDTTIIEFCEVVIMNMTSNPHFPNPNPNLNSVTVALQRYEMALEACKTRSIELTQTKKERRLELETLLRQLAVYVEEESNRDETKIESSGFKVKSKIRRITSLPVPIPLHARPGKTSGSIDLKCTRINGARYYEFAYTTEPVLPKSVWKTVVTTTSKTTIENLISEHPYIFKVTAMTKQTKRNWSYMVRTFSK